MTGITPDKRRSVDLSSQPRITPHLAGLRTFQLAILADNQANVTGSLFIEGPIADRLSGYRSKRGRMC